MAEELARSLRHIDLEARQPTLAHVVRSIAGCLGAEVAIYRPQLREDGWDLEFMHVSGEGLRSLPSVFRAFLRRAPAEWTTFNPLYIDAADRNRVVGPRALRRLMDSTKAPVVPEVYGRLKAMQGSHIRVVISDGPLMLAWVGAFREQAFTPHDARILKSLVQPLRRRLFVERLLDGAKDHDGVAAALERLPGPAFLKRETGTIEFANAAGQALFASEGRSVLTRVRESLPRAGTNGLASIPVRSSRTPRTTLVLLDKPATAVDARLVEARRQWRLTRRQTEVLARIVGGECNKEIAGRLRCSARTVETHVSAVLQRAMVPSRARLAAKFWDQL
jgi:DNA-binding CsgD family transcriptional regulator/PAS domain-containing protein